jgi:hypothetical protein
MTSLIQNILFTFSNINGNFNKLKHLLTKVLNIANYNEKKNKWEWKVLNTTVICTGNFISNINGVKNKEEIKHIINAQVKIIKCFKSLQQQSKQKFNSHFITLMGPHEFGLLLGIKTYNETKYSKEIQSFVDNYLHSFCENSTHILIQWGSFFISHGGLELKWLDDHKITTVKQVNKLWKRLVEEGDKKSLLRVFGTLHSPIHSKKMSLDPDNWRRLEKDNIVERFGYIPFPKFIVSSVDSKTIQETSVNVSKPSCRGSTKSSILSSVDSRGSVDIYFTQENVLLPTISSLKITMIVDHDYHPLTYYCSILA